MIFSYKRRNILAMTACILRRQFTYIESATEELVVVIVTGCTEPEPPHAGAGGRLL
jgi:hypothetical protein